MHPLLDALLRPVDRDDPASVDLDLVQRLAGPLERFGDRWYGLQADGWEHLPKRPVLIVGNHNAGSAFLEALAASAKAVRRGHTSITGLAHDAVIDAPLVGRLLARVGAVRAGHASAARAFDAGRQVVVFPGGNLEAFRRWSHRDRIVLGGRTGFVRLALRHGVDIVPWVFDGGHSSFFVLRDGRRFAKAIRADRWLRSDTWPLYLGLPWGVAFGPWPHLPLPVKVRCRFLPSIPVSAHSPEAIDDPDVVQALYYDVERALQQGLDRLRTEDP